MIIKRGIANLSEDVTENGYRNIINSRVEIYEKTEGNYTEVLAKLLSLTQKTYEGDILCAFRRSRRSRRNRIYNPSEYKCNRCFKQL